MSKCSHLKAVRFSCPDELGYQKVCVEKVNILVKKSMQDQQSVWSVGDEQQIQHLASYTVLNINGLNVHTNGFVRNE